MPEVRIPAELSGKSIQDCIDALPQSGGIVYLPPGKYIIGDTIRIKRSRLSIVGEDRVRTVLIPDRDSQVLPSQLMNVESDVGRELVDVEVRSLTIQANRRFQDGIRFSGTRRCSVSEVDVVGCSAFGFVVEKSQGHVLRDCNAVSCSKGYLIHGESSFCVALQCRAEDSDWDGIHLHSTHNIVAGCELVKNGFRTGGSGDVASGIFCHKNEARECTIVDNVVNETGNFGIDIGGAEKMIVARNTVRDSRNHYNINLAECHDCVIAENRCENPKVPPRSSERSANIVVRDHCTNIGVIDNRTMGGYFGVWIQSGKRHTVVRNHNFGNDIGVQVDDNHPSHQIINEDNTFFQVDRED